MAHLQYTEIKNKSPQSITTSIVTSLVSTDSICYTTATALTATCQRRKRSPIDTQPLRMHEEYEDIVVIEPSKVEEEEKEYNRVVRAAVVSNMKKVHCPGYSQL